MTNEEEKCGAYVTGFDPNHADCDACRAEDPRLFESCKAMAEKAENPAGKPALEEKETMMEERQVQEQQKEDVTEVGNGKAPKGLGKLDILAELVVSGDPMKPAELAAAVTERCGGSAKSASSVVSVAVGFAKRIGAVRTDADGRVSAA